MDITKIGIRYTGLIPIIIKLSGNVKVMPGETFEVEQGAADELLRDPNFSSLDQAAAAPGAKEESGRRKKKESGGDE